MQILPGLENVQNLHPLFVHFPIVLVLITLLFEGLWWITKKDQFRVFATYLLYLSALAAVITVITGYLAADNLGHESPGHEFVHAHRDVMLWMSGILLATALLVFFIRSLRLGSTRRLLIVPLLVIGGLLIYGTDKGGRLVFEFGMGVKAVPTGEPAEGEAHEHGHEHEHEENEMEGAVQQSAHPDSSTHAEKAPDHH